MLEFPSSEYIKPYKLKATYIMAYINLLGGIGMVIGEQVMIIPLIIVHLLQTFIKHNPFPIKQAAEPAVYDNKMKNFLINMIICLAMLVVLLEQHPLAGEGGGKSSKVDPKKIVKTSAKEDHAATAELLKDL